MKRNVAILGASLGGLVAAAELRANGFEVEIIEKGRSVGGLYSEVDTPFGKQEMGMHVVYADARQYGYLCDIFGANSFHTLSGSSVDKGASINDGSTYFDSHYPCLLSHPSRKKILEEMISGSEYNQESSSLNAEEEVRKRFGILAAQNIVSPILEKLWNEDIKSLTKDSLHCYFDLRRLVISQKTQADNLKESPSLDCIIANPQQENPKGQVYGGRIGLVFKKGCSNLSDSFNKWAKKTGVKIKYGCDVSVSQGNLLVNNELLRARYDACIVAVPIHLLASSFIDDVGKADKSELSLYYFQLDKSLAESFPAYYILVHDPKLSSSRIVNYDGYRPLEEQTGLSVIAVEAIHKPRAGPTIEKIMSEVSAVLPNVKIINSYQVPRTLSLFSPTINNSLMLDKFEALVKSKFIKPIYFTGMRTDTGIFFSHHTIGLSHESALECIGQCP